MTSRFLKFLSTVGLIGLLLPAGPRAAAYPGTHVEFEGRGWGHGRGLGQYGALGYAEMLGWGYQQILDHFYGGTSSGTVDFEMSTRLMRWNNTPALIFNVEGEARKVTRIGPNLFSVHRAPTCRPANAQNWWVHLGDQPGPVEFAKPPTDDPGGMLQLCEPDFRRWYRGNMRVVEIGGVQAVVNVVNVEGYLRGVVPREMPASWAERGEGRGMEAVKSQTVGARSYAASEDRWPDLAKSCDTTACQVYGGKGIDPGGVFLDLEDPRTTQAIQDTAGQVRMNGGPARTEFSSSTGGYTAGGTFPPVPDAGDSIGINPNHYWRVAIPVSSIEAAWPTIGTLISIHVTKRNGLGDWGGRALEVRIEGTSGVVTTTGGTFRSKLGLKSDWFRVLSGWESLGGIMTSGADTASWGSNRLDVFARGTDNALWQRWWDGLRWNGWHPLGGVATADPTAVSWGANRIDVFVRGTDNGIWQIYWNGNQWVGWQSLGGVATSSPDATSWSSGRIDVVVRGTDNALWHRFWNGSAWSGWNSLGGVANSDPSVVAWGPNRLDLFVRGTDNALWHKFWNGSAWSGWNSLGGVLTSGPDASSWASDRLHVFARGTDGSLWYRFWTGTAWSGWESPGGGLESDPSAVSWGFGRIDVFARGPDGALIHKWYDGLWRP